MADITPMRTIRVGNDLWQSAQKKAAAEKTTVSDAIRQFLEDWTGNRRETFEDRVAALERIKVEVEQWYAKQGGGNK